MKMVLKEAIKGYTSKVLELAVEITLEIDIFVCEKACLLAWIRAALKGQKKRSQELFVFAVVKTDELSVQKCCKKGGKTCSKAREIHMQGGERHVRQLVPPSGSSPGG